MRLYKLFWTLFNRRHHKLSFLTLVVLATLVACASYTPRGISLLDPIDEQKLKTESADPNSAIVQKQVFDLYCKSGKQIRAMRTNIKYISPKTQKGTPLNVANGLMTSINNKDRCFIQESFRYLSAMAKTEGSKFFSWQWSGAESRLYSTKDSQTEIINYGKSVQLEEDNRTTEFHVMQPYFVVSQKPTPIYLLFGSWRADFDDVNKNIPYYPSIAYLSDLLILRTGYTMLVPSVIQVAAFSADAHHPRVAQDACGENMRYYNRTMGYDRNGNLQPDLALSEKGDIWKRYFHTYTTVKEAPTDDPQITDYEISLDLNQFCQYARNVNDLTSK